MTRVAIDTIEPVTVLPALKPGELQVARFRGRSVSGLPKERARVLTRVVPVTPATSTVTWWAQGLSRQRRAQHNPP